MPRIARVVAPGLPHHVTQRGNRGADVFADDKDRRKYLSMLAEYAGRYGLEIWAYCLTDGGVAFVAAPSTAEALGRTFRDTHQAYAAWFNRKTHETGHLWQGRFASCPLSEAYVPIALRHVERTPVRLGLSDWAEDWPWSSAAAHCGLRTDALLTAPAMPHPPEDWSAWLARTDEEAAVRQLLQRTRTGRPCGPVEFVESLEKTLGRRLALQKPGPKPKPPPPPQTSSADWQFWGDSGTVHS